MVEIRLESAESKSPLIRIIKMFLVDLCGVLGQVALSSCKKYSCKKMVEIRLESAESKSLRIRIIRMFLVDLCGVLGRVALAVVKIQL
jgi:hypothetical protein